MCNLNTPLAYGDTSLPTISTMTTTTQNVILSVTLDSHKAMFSVTNHNGVGVACGHGICTLTV